VAEQLAATLRVVPKEKNEIGALAAYLQVDAGKTRKRLPDQLAVESIRDFETSVRKVTERCQTFLASKDRSVSHLVLGKVQSGKTAHLLGQLAWASDSSISMAVVFTGITDSLNNQTEIRLEKDLTALPGRPVHVMRVPTIRQEKQFAAFVSELRALVRARGADEMSEVPLPVLVTMKNRARGEAVQAAIEAIADEIKVGNAFLAIDDEADQASQNAKSRQRKVAATYSALTQIRDLPVRNIWLSYTATPQALLLTDRFGGLRPDYIAVVPPRQGYFGLSDAMSSSFVSNLVIVDDWRAKAHQLAECPPSLTEAIWRFFMVAWVRTHFPEQFYENAQGIVTPGQRLKSTQMLIHESGAQLDHSRMFHLVEDERERLDSALTLTISGRMTPRDQGVMDAMFQRIADNLSKSGANMIDLLDRYFSPEGRVELLEIVRDTKVSVFNSDPVSATAGDERPVDDADYEAHRTWILIGGDILGRGITIPQLTVTYFLRNAQTPNFDTVLQQLRFCGYRSDYQNWISIHAPSQSFEDLKYMDVVERVVWERALAWDKNLRRLTGQEIPRVLYTAPVAARFEPTRAGVRDPNISDRKINKDYIFALREIFDPSDFRSNLSLLKRWQAEARIHPNQLDSRWLQFNDVSAKDIMRLLGSWSSSAPEQRQLEAVAELYEPGLGDLGLSDVPTVIFLSRSLAENWSSPDVLSVDLSDVLVTRQAKAGASGSSIESWRAAFDQRQFLKPEIRATLVSHVGGGQRALKAKVPHSGVILIVEPILGLLESGNRHSAVALGIGLAALSPDGFDVRMVGHA
jgi:hypothetical protein